MKKVHLLFKKEEIDEAKVNEGAKVAVVLDVLMATTTITSALYDGAKEVIPVLNGDEALRTAEEFAKGEFILAGELDSKPIENFVFPLPSVIRESIKNKTLILSTTNGTVALKNASKANKVYIASLLNNPYVAEEVRLEPECDTILVVCSGNSGGFSLEDFYGAGHFIECLTSGHEHEFELTDAAFAAKTFYAGTKQDGFKILLESRVGRMIDKYDGREEVHFASREGTVPIVPILSGKKVIQLDRRLPTK